MIIRGMSLLCYQQKLQSKIFDRVYLDWKRQSVFLSYSMWKHLQKQPSSVYTYTKLIFVTMYSFSVQH